MTSKNKRVTKWKQIRKIVQYCKETGYCSFDFETDGAPYHSSLSYPTLLGISFQPGSSYTIPLGHFDSPFKDDYIKILKYIGKELLENTHIVKIAWNIQFEYNWLTKYGIHLRGICLDAMLAKHLLDKEKPMGLKPNVDKYLPDFRGYNLPGSGGQNFNWAGVPLKELSKYCGLDCDLTLRLMMFFERRLIDKKLYQLYRNLVMPIAQVLAESSYKGMLVDKEYLEKLEKSYGNRIEKLIRRLKNNKRIKRFERASQRDKIKVLIKSVKKEIKTLEEDEDRLNPEKLIRVREEKISRYLAGEFTTKKELKLIEPVNFASPKQMIDLLFTHKRGFKFKIVKYTVDKKTKRETDTPSTDEEVLLKLEKKDKSGFIKRLLKHRALTKLHGTYMVGILDKLGEDDRVHTSFLVSGTVTGRLSSRNPNLQNIPRGITSSDIKKMFVPPKGYLLLEVDYSQAELRIVAELSKDKVMLDMFKRKYNIHCATAARAYTNMTYEEFYPLTKDDKHPKHLWAIKLKKKAKTYNFGVLYGQSPKKLAQTIADATGDKPNILAAEQGLEDWFTLFPRVKKWIKNQHRIAKNKGYVINIFGRKRRLPKIYSQNYGEMLEAQRQAVNSPIQGAASDFTLFSGVLIREQILKGNLPKYLLPQVYTVHDSIGFYIKPKDMKEVIPKLVGICANPETKKWFGFEMKHVTMKVSPEVGVTWFDLKDYDPEFDYEKLLT